MKRNLSIIAAVSSLMLFVGAGCATAKPAAPVSRTGPDSAVVAAASGPEAAASEQPAAAEKEISLEEVAAHSTPEDCWTAIHGKVYDVSGAASRHPGGPAIYAGCGKDATELFETRPMGSGTPHSDRARELMKNYEIGVLKVQSQ